jgi:hypothetical protein
VKLEEIVGRLARSSAPHLIGVRHHSAALSAAMPALLDAVNPPAIYLELPPELGGWMSWLGHPELEAPVVLAAARPGRLSFYPFADFSPELAAVRWAVARGVDVIAIDAPVAIELPHDRPGSGDRFDAAMAAAGATDLAAFWDHVVESRAPGSSPEAIRRGALAVGIALRADDHHGGGVSASDLVREHHMRAALAGAPANSVAVVGAFHAAALLEDPLLYTDPDVSALERSDEEVVTSLVPYSFELFDMRSGYPAGVRDPALQQQIYAALRDGTPVADVIRAAAVDVARGLRARGHVGGVPDSREAVRMALDLASLRGLREPGRRELIESIESAMARGQRLGRGQVLARAMEASLVGRARGRLAADTPRSGLRTHVESVVSELRLPGPDDGAKSMRLEPMKSDLDRRRHLALARMQAAGIDYAKRTASEAAGGIEAIGSLWDVKWSPATDATAELAGMRGVTLEQACAGALRGRRRRLERDEALTASALVEIIWVAAECGVLDDEELALAQLWSPELVEDAGLRELVAAVRLLERVRAGHMIGVEAAAHQVGDAETEALLRAAVRQLEALSGSEDVDDALAMLELTRILEGSSIAATLIRALGGLRQRSGPLIEGAAAALLVVVGELSAESFGTWIASVVEAAGSPESRRALTLRLRGALAVGGVLFEADPSMVVELMKRIEILDDDRFLARLPALRGGFNELSPAARQRMLDSLAERLGETRFDAEVSDAPELLAILATADRGARADLVARFGELESAPAAPPLVDDDVTPALPPPVGIAPADRWRLILGRQRQSLGGVAGRAARALDELYGFGEGEGSRESDGQGGGREQGFPAAREWAGELEALFGARVRDEVLGAAAEGGRAAGLLELDADEVRPSVDMLRQLLSLAGSLGEGQIARVRKLVERAVRELTRELAIRVRPALTGAALPRPTRRRTRYLDIPRTLRRNLANVRETESGYQIIPEELIFKSGSQRSVDWHLALVVDVSGSMEVSVIYSAMMAAILSSVPWIDVSFYAFNTDVIDLSEHVSDPLSLLLEVSVGGGTHIARALRFARDNLTVPSRSIVVCVTDFEEGFGVSGLLAEVRALAESGARPLGVAALDDSGAARYHAGIAAQVVSCGMPVAALSPLELARWVGEQVSG